MTYLKKHKPAYIIAPLLFCLISLISCEEEVPLELNTLENERIVVEGRITNDLKSHRLRLTKTASYFANELVPPLLDAEVYIEEDNSDSRINLRLTNDSLGFYDTDILAGTIGETYTLFINYNGESYQATTYLDTVPEIDSLSYIYEYVNYEDHGYYKIRMSAYEPPPLGNYYMFNVYINDTLYNDNIGKTPYTDDKFFNDVYLTDIEIIWLPQEEIKRDTNHILIEMLSISEDEYKFNEAFTKETYASGNIFAGPPANIPSNLKCTSGEIDGLGFFGASALVSADMVIYKEHNDSSNDPDYTP